MNRVDGGVPTARHTWKLQPAQRSFPYNGFPLYQQASLSKLKAGTIDTLTPIDGSPAYNGWQDVVGAVSGIIANEAGSEQRVTVHIQDPDMTINTDDHADHTATANAALSRSRPKTNS